MTEEFLRAKVREIAKELGMNENVNVCYPVPFRFVEKMEYLFSFAFVPLWNIVN